MQGLVSICTLPAKGWCLGYDARTQRRSASPGFHRSPKIDLSIVITCSTEAEIWSFWSAAGADLGQEVQALRDGVRRGRGEVLQGAHAPRCCFPECMRVSLRCSERREALDLECKRFHLLTGLTGHA